MRREAEVPTRAEEGPSGPEPSSRSRARGSLVAVSAALAPSLVAVALALAGPIVSGDLWWHLRAGAWILDHGALPVTDPFSHTAGETRWILQEYGAQVLFALLERAGGIGLLRAAGAVLGVALLLLVQRIGAQRVGRGPAAALTALFALLFALKWELRPHLLSAFLFLALEGALFPRGRRRALGGGGAASGRLALALLAIACLWVQLHAEALFAPILAFACFLGALCTLVLERRGGLRRAGSWGLAFLAALAGSALSPLGFAQHEYALLGRSVPQRFIEEWFRPWVLPGDERFAPVTLPLFGLFWGVALAGAVFVAAQAVGRLRGRREGERVLSWERIGFLGACLALAFSARRFLWLAWFPALDLAVLAARRRPSLAGARLVPLAAAWLLAWPLLGTHYPREAREALARGTFAEATDDELFPVHAATLAADAELEGNLFHPYEWGGYLGWRLGPRAPVFIDGRTVLFEDVILERWTAERDLAVAARVFAERDVRIVVFRKLVDHGRGPEPWTPAPVDGVAWVRAWTDALATLWLRADDEENLARVEAELARHGVPFDPEIGFDEAFALRARPEWLEERRLLPAPVARRVRELASEGADPIDLGLERARVYRGARMRRLARTELELWIRARFADRPEERDQWLARLSGDGLDATLERALRLPRREGAGG